MEATVQHRGMADAALGRGGMAHSTILAPLQECAQGRAKAGEDGPDAIGREGTETIVPT